jgi:NAD(P)-dependent dehydrogenase (short-subunit alcohol dehydrogenase family)
MAKSEVVKVALVTGGARGIGRSIAAALAAEGMGVVVADLLDTSECVEQVRAGGGKAMGVRADMADPTAAKEAVSRTVEAFGRLDVLINNAGMHPQGRGWPPLREMELEFWERIIRANLTSTAVSSRAALPHLADKHTGRIVNISGGGPWGGPEWVSKYGNVTGRGPYMAAKAGVEILTRVMWEEEKNRGVAVTCLRPIIRIALDYESEEIRARNPGPEILMPHLLWLLSAGPAEVGGRVYEFDGVRLSLIPYLS